MGDDKVKESPAEMFATVAEVNTLFHSLEDMLATRFEAIDGRFGVLDEKLAAMDARNEGRFAAIGGRFGVLDEKLAAMDARIGVQFAALEQMFVELDTKTEGRFDLVEQNFKSQELKIEHCVTSANNKLMVILLVIAGSIIAGLLYGG